MRRSTTAEYEEALRGEPRFVGAQGGRRPAGPEGGHRPGRSSAKARCTNRSSRRSRRWKPAGTRWPSWPPGAASRSCSRCFAALQALTDHAHEPLRVSAARPDRRPGVPPERGAGAIRHRQPCARPAPWAPEERAAAFASLRKGACDIVLTTPEFLQRAMRTSSPRLPTSGSPWWTRRTTSGWLEGGLPRVVPSSGRGVRAAGPSAHACA